MNMTVKNSSKTATAAAGAHRIELEPDVGTARAHMVEALRPLTPLLAAAAFFVTTMGLVGSLLVA